MNGPRWAFLAILAIVPLHFIYEGTIVAWSVLPDFAGTWYGSMICGVAVILSGWLFYRLRESRRFYYSVFEIAVAGFVAFEACMELATNRDRWHWMLAMLGALYIAVRGFDNYSKAKAEALDGR